METVIGLAQEPEKAIAFNLASQALNNSFFLSGLVSVRLACVGVRCDGRRALGAGEVKGAR